MIIVDQVCFRFLIPRSFPKIFTFKFKHCPKSSQIFNFVPSEISGVQAPPKNLYISDNAHLNAYHVAKYCETTPTIPKGIRMHLLNLKPIFDPHLKKL